MEQDEAIAGATGALKPSPISFCHSMGGPFSPRVCSRPVKT